MRTNQEEGVYLDAVSLGAVTITNHHNRYIVIHCLLLRSQLMLYAAAARGNFEQGLREMDARAECILCPPEQLTRAHQRKVTQAAC